MKDRRNGLLQLVLSNNKAIFQFIHAWNQEGTIVDNFDISLLQLLRFWKKYS